jgi:hypothetical protein
LGKFIEDIVLPYGEDEAAKRIGTWLGTEAAKSFKVKKKGPGYVKLKGTWGNIVTGKQSIWFELWVRPEGVHAECWVGGMVKTSIEPGLWGALPRKKAWDRYLSLKGTLQSGTPAAAAKAAETVAVERVICTHCGAAYALKDDMILEDGNIQCQNCLKPFARD